MAVRPQVDHFEGLVMPALEMVGAMSDCSTPVQKVTPSSSSSHSPLFRPAGVWKVRLWVEAVLAATSQQGLIATHLMGGSLSADDLPSLVLFLTCLADCDHIVAQVSSPGIPVFVRVVFVCVLLPC